MIYPESSSSPAFAKASSGRPLANASSDRPLANASSDRPLSNASSGGPLVSVLMLTRNQESFIREGIVELMEQSVAPRMEVIVVDAGSEQSEWAVLADLQRRYRNLIALRTTGEHGINLALKIASGRYLTLLEPSDRMRQDAYQRLAAALDGNPDAMLVYGDTCSTAVPHQTYANHTSSGKMIWPEYTAQQLDHLPQVAPHPMWRRELHDSIGPFSVDGEGGVRWLLQQVAGRFTMIHLEEFTGLRLAALSRTAAATIPQTGAVALPQGPRPEPFAQPAAPVPIAEPQAPPSPPVSAEEAYQSLREVLKGPDLRQAAGALESHLARYPEHAVAHNDLAAVSYQLGEKDKALSHYRIAVQLSPCESVYRKNLADLLFVEGGEVDEAIGIYLELHRSAPRDVETLLNLGIISAQVGQPDEAETFLQRALELEPWNQVARERLTELRETRGGDAEPLPDADEESAEERYEKAQAMVQRGELEEAERELERIIESYPEFSPAHNDIGVLCYQKGAKDEAVRHYQKAAALAPGNSIFQKNLADFYFVEGRDVDGAIAIYLELLRKEPKNVETLMSLGKICSILDRPQEAESFYGKVTQLEPWNQDARDCLDNLRSCANA